MGETRLVLDRRSFSNKGGKLNPLGYSLQKLFEEELQPVGLPCRSGHKMRLVAWEDSYLGEKCVLCGQVKVIRR